MNHCSYKTIGLNTGNYMTYNNGSGSLMELSYSAMSFFPSVAKSGALLVERFECLSMWKI